jgi:hypothetical protein
MQASPTGLGVDELLTGSRSADKLLAVAGEPKTTSWGLLVLVVVVVGLHAALVR